VAASIQEVAPRSVEWAAPVSARYATKDDAFRAAEGSKLGDHLRQHRHTLLNAISDLAGQNRKQCDSPFHNGSSRIKVGLVGRSDSQFDLLFEAAIGSSDGSQAALRPL
jgi:hypothetical protein